MPEELVLCFPRALFDDIGAFQGIQSELDAYIPRILEPQHTRFIPRSQAENDPSWASAASSGVKQRSRKPPALARTSRYSGR